jgi:heparan-alpha-glucosaminide N-acetyltransferase
VDAYRGFVMTLMMAEVLRLARMAQLHPGSAFWSFLAFHQTHAAWVGCSLHDTIQPGFSFLVGVALPYSIASRLAKGKSFGRMFAHALWRSFALIALGIVLRSIHAHEPYYTFEDTLTQIGLGYPFLFLLGFRKPRWQWTALAAILFAYWLAWALFPPHWMKDYNLGVAFDQWFLNLFPRSSPFVTNSGGYVTLSFIPTLGTMILGLIAGGWLRGAAPRIPMKKLVTAGAVCIALGLALHFAGVCPIVKRIWTPSWTLFSGGLCFFFLAAFCWVIEVKGWRRWAFPLIVVGTNSIAAYLLAELLDGPLLRGLRDLFGRGVEPLVLGTVVLAMYWAVLFAMWQRRVFLRL